MKILQPKLLVFRIIATLVSVFGMTYRLIIDPIGGGGLWQSVNNLGYFTIQSNLLVMVIFILLLLNQLRGTPEKSPPPALRGAALLYIIVTSLVFLLLLKDRVSLSGLSHAVLYVNHLATAVLLLIDNVASIRPGTYRWGLLPRWLIYPLAYLFFSVFEGLVFGRFRYFFLNFREMGTGYFFLYIFLLLLVFASIGAFIIFLNRVFRPAHELA